jgi:hypothetical protein
VQLSARVALYGSFAGSAPYERVYVYTRMGISNYVSQLVTNASSATCLILSADSRVCTQQRLHARYMGTSSPPVSLDERQSLAYSMCAFAMP